MFFGIRSPVLELRPHAFHKWDRSALGIDKYEAERPCLALTMSFGNPWTQYSRKSHASDLDRIVRSGSEEQKSITHHRYSPEGWKCHWRRGRELRPVLTVRVLSSRVETKQNSDRRLEDLGSTYMSFYIPRSRCAESGAKSLLQGRRVCHYDLRLGIRSVRRIYMSSVTGGVQECWVTRGGGYVRRPISAVYGVQWNSTTITTSNIFLHFFFCSRLSGKLFFLVNFFGVCNSAPQLLWCPQSWTTFNFNNKTISHILALFPFFPRLGNL